MSYWDLIYHGFALLKSKCVNFEPLKHFVLGHVDSFTYNFVQVMK